MRLDETMLFNGIAAINIPATSMAFGPINKPMEESVPLIMFGNLIWKANKNAPTRIDQILIFLAIVFRDKFPFPTIIKRQCVQNRKVCTTIKQLA